MSELTIEYTLPSGNREEKRENLIRTFINEKPGTGTGKDASRYRYNVETYKNYKIFLKRPTQLNKGFDFTVNIEGLYFKKNRRYTKPSHQDIIDALNICKDMYPHDYETIGKIITDIYNCKDIKFPKKLKAEFIDYKGDKHPIQIILLAIKWLFIEQDCAYWNYSGRTMLYRRLISEKLV